MKANVYELLARSRKTAHIVLTIEDMARGLNVDPLELAGHLSDEQWRAIAVCAGQRPASDATRDAVITMLEERIRRAS